MHYVYIAKNQLNRPYIGVSKDLDKRLHCHNKKRGAQFTKNGNYKIVFCEKYPTLAEARKREIQIKKWRRDKKEKLIERFKKRLPTKINNK